MVFVALVAFSYLVFWESAEKDYNTVVAASQKLEDKIRVDKQYLLINPETKIIKIDQDIKTLNARLMMLKDENSYIISEIKQIPELFYDQRTWGAFIDSIAQKARVHKVKLNYFANRLATDKTKFGHVLNLEIKAVAPYKNMIRFMNSIEKSKLVVDLHDMQLTSDSKLNMDLNLSVWGITY